MAKNKETLYAFVPYISEDRTPSQTCVKGLRNLVKDFAARMGLTNFFGLATKEEILDRSKSAEQYFDNPQGTVIRITFEEITTEEFHNANSGN